jgi:NADH-quinone oxidoreductase subunit N
MTEGFNWVTVYPEFFLLAMALIIMLVDVGVKSIDRAATYFLTVLTLAVLVLLQADLALMGKISSGFYGMVISDPLGNWLKCFASIATLVSIVYSRQYVTDRGMLSRGGEFYILPLFSLLGMFVMISGSNLLVLYLGLELLTLPSYALVALRREDSTSTEASMKYFVLGALASGFLLYGMSMIYGATGSLDSALIFMSQVNGTMNSAALLLGVVFIVAGLAFKLGVAPFHMWIPDVYQGAPTAVTLLIGGAPKLAAFALVIRLLVGSLLLQALHWQEMLLVLSVLSLLLGNLAAIMQTNIKRMLAYSTISQMGFVLLGLLSGITSSNNILGNATNAYSSSMFYVISYVMTTLVSFGVIMVLARKGFENDKLSDFAGLNQRSPLYAGIMAMCLLSLAGVPPMIGFYAKFAVLQALVAQGTSFGIGVAIFAVIMSLIGAFYYLRVIKVMYFDSPTNNEPITAPLDAKFVLGLNALLVLVIGIFPNGLMAISAFAIRQLIGI